MHKVTTGTARNVRLSNHIRPLLPCDKRPHVPIAPLFPWIARSVELVANQYTGYCGNTLATGSTMAAAGDCSFACAGDATEHCGAGNRLSVWKRP